MPLDPQAQALIASLAGAKPVEQMTVQEMRDGLEQRTLVTGGIPEPVDQVIAGEVPGSAGARPVTPFGSTSLRAISSLVRALIELTIPSADGTSQHPL